jgi:glucose-6-phosphate isomerase
MEVEAVGSLAAAVHDRLRRLDDDRTIERIWVRDHTVWKPDPDEIADRLGWLTVAGDMRARLADLRAFARDVAASGFTDAVLLGMGGSSLAPEVMRKTFGVASGALDLHVLDTTHPAAVVAAAQRLSLDRTLFVVASKSGSTIETLSHLAYFWEACDGDGSRFVAITDPASSLETLARDRSFRATFTNPPDIGGRYSALSLFGLVPAALIGAPLDDLVDGAESMAEACRLPPKDNPGARLGAVLGEAARAGRDKATIVLPDALGALGVWIEQLIAESTGKENTGILPVIDEPLGAPDVYGADRLFTGTVDGVGEHPVFRIDDAGSLGAEFFRWEFATAVAGAVLGIQPFDQPNVAEAKQATQDVLARGAEPVDAGDARALLDGKSQGDYVAILAFVEPSAANDERLQRVRVAIRDRHRVAVTTGFGPRYLHSTGQLHKGGPPAGRFIQVVDGARATDVAIPDARYTFGELLAAQALGDLRALRSRGRPVARVTLDELEEMVE